MVHCVNRPKGKGQGGVKINIARRGAIYSAFSSTPGTPPLSGMRWVVVYLFQHSKQNMQLQHNKF